MTEPRTYLSLGAGVQSTAMLLAIQTGDLELSIPPPRLAIFADTGWEPQRVYQHLEALRAVSGIPIDLVRSSRPPLREATENPIYGNHLDIPAHIRKPNGETAIGKRQCTNHWKIVPMERAMRADMGITRFGPKHRVRQLLGISTDEAQRMRHNTNRHIKNVYPLIDAGWSRSDCLAWLRNRYPELRPGKSACIGCPYHGNGEWRGLSIEERADAIEIDLHIRDMDPASGQQFLHYSRRPLADVFEAFDRQPGLFTDEPGMGEDECSGHCFI